MHTEPNDDGYWIPLADLMTGMMLIFLLISIALILKMRHVTDSYQKVKSQIYSKLYSEFKNDLPKWGASLSKDDLSIRFNEPSILFATGQSGLKPQFKDILAKFFPRYIKILSEGNYKELSEIRIEGYTSSMWSSSVSADEKYFLNMDLSQQRTRQVLEYIYNLPNTDNIPKNMYKNFIKNYVTANGLSSSHLIYNKNGKENIKASQRVEFKIDLKADQQINQLYRTKI